MRVRAAVGGELGPAETPSRACARPRRPARWRLALDESDVAGRADRHHPLPTARRVSPRHVDAGGRRRRGVAERLAVSRSSIGSLGDPQPDVESGREQIRRRRRTFSMSSPVRTVSRLCDRAARTTTVARIAPSTAGRDLDRLRPDAERRPPAAARASSAERQRAAAERAEAEGAVRDHLGCDEVHRRRADEPPTNVSGARS